MKGKAPLSTRLVALPLLLGVASFFAFGLYFYSANHPPYTYIDSICAGPVLSLIGVILSIVTRKSRKAHPTLWMSGLLTCLFGFAVCVLVFLLLVMVMAAAFSGRWL